MFEHLPERDTAVDACAEVLRHAILSGELPSGARLPPERVLSQNLGVNRTTLRSALRELATSGLLSVRQGSGYCVLDFREEGGLDLVPAMLDLARERGQFHRSCVELLRVRRWLAGSLLERLDAHPPSQEALACVSVAIDVMADSERSPLERVVSADLAVVSALIAAADSDVLAVMLAPIGRILAGLPDLAAAIYAEPAGNVAAWRMLLVALQQGSVPIELWLSALRARDVLTLERLVGR